MNEIQTIVQPRSEIADALVAAVAETTGLKAEQIVTITAGTEQILIGYRGPQPGLLGGGGRSGVQIYDTKTGRLISDDLLRLALFTIAERRTPDWDDLPEGLQAVEAASYNLAMRATLEAVYPAIRQQVAEEIAAKGNQIAEEYQATAITHRDLSDEHGRSLKGTSHMATAHAYRNKADGAWAVAHAAREIGGAE